MIAYNTIEISTAKMDMRIFEADNKTVIQLEQSTGICFITFDSLIQFNQFALEVASCIQEVAHE